LTRADVVRFYDTWFHPSNATLVVVGDTTLAEIRPKLEKLLAGWKRGTAPEKKLAPAPTRAAASVYVIDRPGALQSVILAGEAVPPRNNPREIALETLNTVLGGQFSARLNMNLREDKHWSYGAGSALIGARGERPFVVFAPVQTDKTKESLAEVAKELRGIRGERPVTPEELTFAQKGQTLTLPGRWETGGAVSSDVGEIVRYGLDDRYFDGYAARVNALTLGDLSGVASVVHPDRMIWVVVGDRGKIEAGVREMKLGTVRSLDADGNVLPESR